MNQFTLCISLLLFLYLFSVGSKEKKKNDKEKTVEMSKNAQFRAIQPSQSILSYVEENVILHDQIFVVYLIFYIIISLARNIHFNGSCWGVDA